MSNVPQGWLIIPLHPPNPHPQKRGEIQRSTRVKGSQWSFWPAGMIKLVFFSLCSTCALAQSAYCSCLEMILVIVSHSSTDNNLKSGPREDIHFYIVLHSIYRFLWNVFQSFFLNKKWLRFWFRKPLFWVKSQCWNSTNGGNCKQTKWQSEPIRDDENSQQTFCHVGHKAWPQVFLDSSCLVLSCPKSGSSCTRQKNNVLFYVDYVYCLSYFLKPEELVLAKFPSFVLWWRQMSWIGLE